MKSILQSYNDENKGKLWFSHYNYLNYYSELQYICSVVKECLEDLRNENPVLANVMAQLDYMEKRGSGLTRICNETKAMDGYKDELKLVFKSTPTQFQTIIYATTDSQNVGVLSEGQLPDRQLKILKMIQASPTISAKAMSETLSVSPRTIERDIASLKKMGILHRQGKDNDGVWVIMD